MKTLLLTLLLALPTFAQQVKLAWDANTEPDIAGYRVYYRTNDTAPLVQVDVGNVTLTTVSNLTVGVTYTFFATAYNTGVAGVPSQESAFSEPVVYTVPAPATAPVFVNHPLSRTVNLGGETEFRASLTGTPPMSYQWYKNGVPLAGATSGVYLILTVTTNDAGSYQLRVSNSAGTAFSNPATLTVRVPPGRVRNFRPNP
jgi:hypothetical protein